MKYTIDCFSPVDDKVLDMATFEKFLKDRIKVSSCWSVGGFIGGLGVRACVSAGGVGLLWVGLSRRVPGGVGGSQQSHARTHSALTHPSTHPPIRPPLQVNGKAGALGDTVSISRDKAKLTVTAELPFSKRYLKYLTKKHLKKQQLRDYLRVS